MGISRKLRYAGLSLIGLLAASPAWAAISSGLEETGKQAGYNTTSTKGLPEIIGSVIAAFAGLLGTVFMVLMLYGGWLWFTSQGDTKQVQKAKDVIINSVIGLAIILTAYAITNFILGALLTGTGN